MPVFISRPFTALPSHRYSQEEIRDFMLATPLNGDGDRRKIRKVYQGSGIENRYSVLDSFRTDSDTLEFGKWTTAERMNRYSEEAFSLGSQLIRQTLEERLLPQDKSLKEITHLVWVSCTGLVAPGMESRLRSSFSFRPELQTTAFNFLGCHGFFHGLRYASSLVESRPEALVLVLCVELCTLHFKENATEDQILANSLFGDGGAGVLVSGIRPQWGHIQQISQSQFYFPEGAGEMAWSLGDFGFDMRLSRELPAFVSEGIQNSLLPFLEEGGLKQEDIQHWILHPGGKRILDFLMKSLGLNETDLRHSAGVLRLVGNVSSASVLFALDQLFGQNSDVPSGYGLMLGIGPGLSLEMALFVV